MRRPYPTLFALFTAAALFTAVIPVACYDGLAGLGGFECSNDFTCPSGYVCVGPNGSLPNAITTNEVYGGQEVPLGSPIPRIDYSAYQCMPTGNDGGTFEGGTRKKNGCPQFGAFQAGLFCDDQGPQTSLGTEAQASAFYSQCAAICAKQADATGCYLFTNGLEQLVCGACLSPVYVAANSGQLTAPLASTCGGTIIRDSGADAKTDATAHDSGSDSGGDAASCNPPARAGASIAYDTNRGVTVLFGGCGSLDCNSGPYFDDVWEWNGTSWTQAPNGGNGPIARASAGMTYDPSSQLTVLFGGETDGSSSDFDDATWGWSGTSWSQLATSGPSPRNGPSMVWDANLDEIVLFGGNVTGFEDLSDTWLWDGSSWSESFAGGTPPARAYFPMIYDTSFDEEVLFGGCSESGCSSPLGDTWTYTNDQGWQQQSFGGPSPPPSAPGTFSMVFDSQYEEGVLVDTDPSTNITSTWLFGNGWISQTGAASPPGTGVMAYDSQNEVVVYFGGQSNGNPLAETWTWNGTAWTNVTPSCGGGGPNGCSGDQTYCASGGLCVTPATAGFCNLGEIWSETEGSADCGATWTRQCDSSTFTMSQQECNGHPATGTLVITTSGMDVSIARTDTSDQYSCTYSGTFSLDCETVSGSYSCALPGQGPINDGEWSATIEQ
jgi:hypothetical protein